MKNLSEKQGFICDMDGVIYHGNTLLPGVKEFVNWLQKEEKKFLFLTNSSEYSPLELRQKLARMGLEVDESHFYTSALATAHFLKNQMPGCSAYVIGAPGLLNALYDAGITMNDVNPDYVIVGETRAYNYDSVLRAVSHVRNGARLIGTNTDLTGPSETGIIPACRALIAPIELAAEKAAYFIGKPNGQQLSVQCHGFLLLHFVEQTQQTFLFPAWGGGSACLAAGSGLVLLLAHGLVLGFDFRRGVQTLAVPALHDLVHIGQAVVACACYGAVVCHVDGLQAEALFQPVAEGIRFGLGQRSIPNAQHPLDLAQNVLAFLAAGDVGICHFPGHDLFVCPDEGGLFDLTHGGQAAGAELVLNFFLAVGQQYVNDLGGQPQMVVDAELGVQLGARQAVAHALGGLCLHGFKHGILHGALCDIAFAVFGDGLLGRDLALACRAHEPHGLQFFCSLFQICGSNAQILACPFKCHGLACPQQIQVQLKAQQVAAAQQLVRVRYGDRQAGRVGQEIFCMVHALTSFFQLVRTVRLSFG